MKYLYVGSTADILEESDREAVAVVSRRVAANFDAPVRGLELPSIDFALDASRGQYGSIPVLEWLGRKCPGDASKLLAVTGRDLFIPVLTFVYGHAQLGGRVAVMSLARLRQEFYGLPRDSGILLERAVKEGLHETGHTFGLTHCADRRCVMTLGTNIRQVDAKGAAFCRACAARLERRTIHPHDAME
jgi:archaemetzincin